MMKHQVQRTMLVDIHRSTKCCFCDAPLKLPGIPRREGAKKCQVHHLRHQTYDGHSNPSNLRLICCECHRKYHQLFNWFVVGRPHTRLIIKWMVINIILHWMYAVQTRVAFFLWRVVFWTTIV